MHFKPMTKIGNWSLWLFVLFVLFFALSSIFSFISPTSSVWRTLVNIFAISGLVTSLMAALFGLAAIFKYKDRSIAVFAIAIIGVLVVVFLVAELIFG